MYIVEVFNSNGDKVKQTEVKDWEAEAYVAEEYGMVVEVYDVETHDEVYRTT